MSAAVPDLGIHELVSSMTRTGTSELHWVPRSAAAGKSRRELVCVVSPQLGAADWSRLDPGPVRVSKGVPRGSIPALYAWQRHGPEYVWCESQEEKDQLMWLDWEGEVQRLWPQPFAIVFPASVPRNDWHVPDFLGLLSDGSLKLFDVRPRERISEHVASQFALTAQVCAVLGWPYQVLDGTGQTPRATQNLKWLKATRHARCAPAPDVRDRILNSARDGATRRDLCQIAEPDCPPRAASWVDHLVWHRLLACNIHDPYNSTTRLTLNAEALR